MDKAEQMETKQLNVEDQQYVDAMGLFISQTEMSISHSKMIIRQCQERIEMDRKLIDIQQQFIVMNGSQIVSSRNIVDEFIKSRTDGKGEDKGEAQG